MCNLDILLTGSGGFIGENLKKYLSGKYNLLTPRSYDLDLTNADAVRNYFSENDIDLVIHCATRGGIRGIVDDNTTIDDNLSMVKNILSSKSSKCRVILFGSGAMYDKSRELHKVKESEIGRFVPKDLYGKSKMLIADMVKGREDVVCLNIFACYGDGEKSNRFPTYAITQVLNNKPIIINQNVIFDYLYVEDMQRIVEHFILSKPVSGNIINITPDESVSLYDISNIVNEFNNNKVSIRIENTIMNKEYTGDNALLKENIPNFKFTTMKNGLNKFYDKLKDKILIKENV